MGGMPLIDTGISVASKTNTVDRRVNNHKLRKVYFDISSMAFSKIVKRTSPSFLENIQMRLDGAEMVEPATAYLSGVFFAGLLAGIFFSACTVAFYLISAPYFIPAALIPISVFSVVVIGVTLPHTMSSSRGKKIDENLGSAFAFISAMSNADVPISEIIIKLAEMKEYGEVSREAQKISNRIELLGIDIFTAMQQVAKDSPSVEWQKFLQGAVAASSAGARLKPYFVNRATEYQDRLRVSLKKNAESVSVFAETYVAVGVAFPLFLIVILSVMAVITGTRGATTISFLVLFSFLVLPVTIALFVLMISSVNKEVRIS